MKIVFVKLAVISVTPEYFIYMYHMLFVRSPRGLFNVIILDSLNISMHTYALPNAMLPCAFLSPCWFYRSARAFKRTLQYHKHNNSDEKSSETTDEVLVCPLNVKMIRKSAANIWGFYLKCRKGRGPYLSQVFPSSFSLSLELCSISDTWWSIFDQRPHVNNTESSSFIYM